MANQPTPTDRSTNLQTKLSIQFSTSIGSTNSLYYNLCDNQVTLATNSQPPNQLINHNNIQQTNINNFCPTKIICLSLNLLDTMVLAACKPEMKHHAASPETTQLAMAAGKTFIFWHQKMILGKQCLWILRKRGSQKFR